MKIQFFLMRILSIFLMVSIVCCGENNFNYQENDDNQYQNLSNIATPVSIKDISGNWRGSYTDKDFGFRVAIKLTVNLDGTYKRVFFSEGDPIDSAFGKVETFVEREDKTDNYGENKVTKYLHGAKFHFNTEWGSRTEVYQISPGFHLIPVRSFVDGGTNMTLTRDKN